MSVDKNKDIGSRWKIFLDGDKKAFTDIYYSFIDVLWSYGKKLTNDHEIIRDSLQEVFLDLYLKRTKDHVSIKNPKAYLFVALKNSILKKILKNKRKIDSKELVENHNADFQIEYSFQSQLIEMEISEDTRKHLQNAIQNLSPGQKEIIYLKFEEGLGYKEIAIIMKITVDSARKQLYRALVSLRKILDKEDFMMILFIFNLLERNNTGLKDHEIG